MRGVLLDVDDTLVDTRSAMRAAASECARAVWPDAGDPVLTGLGVHFHADPGGYFRRYTRGELTFEQMRLARLRDSAAEHGLAWADDAFDVFEDAWPGAFRSQVRLFDDVGPFLDRCRARGLSLGVLTNSSQRFTDLKLDAVGLADAFAVVATTDTLGYGKPDPHAFTHACGLLGVAPGETLYVGDDLDVDARAAGAAGLRGVWLDRPCAADERAGAARADLDVVRVRSLNEIGLDDG